MTDFLWNLMIVESLGLLTIALFRNRLSFLMSSALFAGWLIGGAATARHSFFALLAAAFHIAIYVALAWLVFAISKRIRPHTDERLVGWRRWRFWSIIVASFFAAYHLGAESNLIDGVFAFVVQAGLFSAGFALFLISQIRAEAQRLRRDAAIEAELQDIRANAAARDNQGLGRE